MYYARFYIFAVAMGLTIVLGAPNGGSFQELRKLMRQQEPNAEQLKLQQFNEDFNFWAEALEQMGLDFLTFVAQCRVANSHCGQRRVQRNLRSLQRNQAQLYAQLQLLTRKYLEEQMLEPTLVACSQTLREYNNLLRQINAEAYKLVEQ